MTKKLSTLYDQTEAILQRAKEQPTLIEHLGELKADHQIISE